MSRNESFQGNKFRHETKVVGETCAADIDAVIEPRYRERRREPHDKLRGSSEILDPILIIPQWPRPFGDGVRVVKLIKKMSVEDMLFIIGVVGPVKQLGFNCFLLRLAPMIFDR